MLTRTLFGCLMFAQASLAATPGLGRGEDVYLGGSFTTDISLDALYSSNSNFTRNYYYLSGSFYASLNFGSNRFKLNSFHFLIGSNDAYFSIDTAASSVLSSGNSISPGDLLLYDTSTPTASLLVDNSELGLPDQVKIDGYSRLSNGDQLFSFDQDFQPQSGGFLAGLSIIYKNDIIGVTPSGTSYFFLDSLNLGYGTINIKLSNRLNLDSIHVNEGNGEVLLGFDTAGEIAGIPFYKSDLLGYNRYGSGQWRLAWDGPAKSSRMYAINVTGFSGRVTGDGSDILFSDSLEKRWRY